MPEPAPVPVQDDGPASTDPATVYFTGVPAPCTLAVEDHHGRGRPRRSPFDKAHPVRKRVGAPSPFWRDMQPLLPRLLHERPDSLTDTSLGSLEAYAQCVHVLRTALHRLDPTTPIGSVQAWLEQMHQLIAQCPAGEAITDTLNKLNNEEN